MNMFRRDVPATVGFGRFRLDMHRRELFADGVPVPVGGRAFDVLIALIEARGQLVTKDELLSRVWPENVVEENTLQFQISMLRKALGPNRDFIKTICGRGYRFIAEISSLPDPGVASLAQLRDSPSSATPKGPTTDLIGPEAILAELADLVVSHRLTALVCSSADKTRLGSELGRRLLVEFTDGAWISALKQSSVPDPVLPTAATALDLAEAGPATHVGPAPTLLPKCLLFLLSIGAQVRP